MRHLKTAIFVTVSSSPLTDAQGKIIGGLDGIFRLYQKREKQL